MNKAALVNAISAKTGISQKIGKKIIDTLIDVVSSELQKGIKIDLVGFGSFKTAYRKQRNGRNPQTGDVIVIPATIAPVFKPGKALKDLVNKETKQ